MSKKTNKGRRPEFMRETSAWADATAEVVTEKIRFNGRDYEPDMHRAYIVTEVCHSLPSVNLKKRAFSVQTLLNSYASMRHQLGDFGHRLVYYGAERDEIGGAVVDVEFPSKKDALAAAAKGEAVPVRLLAVVWKKAEGVADMLTEIAKNEVKWCTSMECAYNLAASALWDGEKYLPWPELSEEMQSLVEAGTVRAMDGKEYALAMGGEDGEVKFGGFGFTPIPADPDADILEAAASVEINAGWKSAHDWQQAVAEAGPKEPDAQGKGSILIGRTQDAEGHSHEIAMNLDVLPELGHLHYLRVVSFDPSSGVLEGVTSAHYEYNRVDDVSREHVHLVSLGGGAASSVAGLIPDGAEDVEMEKWLKVLTDVAAALRVKDPDAAKKVDESIAAMKAEMDKENVEEVVAARIKNGDLIPKAAHAEAVEAAKAAGKAEAEQAQKDAKAAEKAKADALAARAKAIDDAGLDPDFKLGPDRTYASVANAIPATEDGAKEFETRIGEWKYVAESTGQGKKPEKKDETATVSGASGIPPYGGGSGGDAKTPSGAAMV